MAKEKEEKTTGIELRAVYPTNFRNLDTLIAFDELDETTGELIQRNRGILSGSLITFIGVSGSGKSTLAAQIMSNMARPFMKDGYEDVKIHIIDNEGGLFRNRFKVLTNFVDDDIDKHVIFETRNSIEYFNKLTLDIIESKKKMKKIKVKGYTGKMIEILPPTFIFVDALSEMMMEEMTEEEKADNKMMYMTQARLLDQYFKKFKNQFVEYNINMYCIAHMAKKMNLENPMARPVREWKALPADVKINGGKNFLFNTDIGIYISSIVANSPEAIEKKSASYLEAGAIMEAKLWKSRQGRDNVNFFLVSDANGFNPIKSFIYECTQLKVIESAGAVRKLKGTDYSMRSGQMIDKFIAEPEFRKSLFNAYDHDKSYIFEQGRKGAEDRKQAIELLDLMNE